MKYDLAIIGGGPAGAAAGGYAARKRLKTIFITKDWNGQSAVSDGIENWIGDIKISGPELAKKLEAHLKAYSENVVDIREGELCQNISGSAPSFKIKTNKDIYEAKTILVTTGSHRRSLDIPGAAKYENKGLTYCATCDGPLFDSQDVVVVGGGNAGFESAAQLLSYCKSVTLLNRSNTFKADPATIEKVLANPKMRAVKNAVPKEIKGDKFVTSLIYADSSSNKDAELAVTGIFVEIGSLPNTDFVKEFVIMDQYNQIVVDPRNQRSSTIGIWAAGDCTDGLYHQNNIAAGDAIKAIEDIYLELHTKKNYVS